MSKSVASKIAASFSKNIVRDIPTADPSSYADSITIFKEDGSWILNIEGSGFDTFSIVEHDLLTVPEGYWLNPINSVLFRVLKY